MADGKNWYRIEVDQDGKVVSCALAEGREHDNGLIFYVRARDTRHAGRLAFNAYMLALTKARHAQYAREGRCRCGRQRDIAGRKWCRQCLEANKVYKKRSRGEVGPREERAVVLARHREQDRGAFRLEILREVHRHLLAARSPADGLRWLRSEIEKLSEGKAA